MPSHSVLHACNAIHAMMKQLSQRSTSVPHHDMTTKPHTCLMTFTNQHVLNMPDIFLFPRRTFYKACWMPQLSQTNATINHAMDLTRRSAQRLNTAPNHGRAPFNAGQRGHQENTGLTIRKFLRFAANRGCWAGFSAPGASESLISVPAHLESSDTRKTQVSQFGNSCVLQQIAAVGLDFLHQVLARA